MQFYPVNRTTPCLICEKPDWCKISEDGQWLICRRIDAGGRLKIDSSGGEYWVYSTDAEIDLKSVILPQTPDVEDKPRADDDTLNQVYSSVLDMLTLSDNHREQLLARGLSEETIERRMYRTLSSASRKDVVPTFHKSYPETQLLTVRGFFIDQNGSSQKLVFGGGNGLLIPCDAAADRIVALMVRLDYSRGCGECLAITSSHP